MKRAILCRRPGPPGSLRRKNRRSGQAGCRLAPIYRTHLQTHRGFRVIYQGTVIGQLAGSKRCSSILTPSRRIKVELNGANVGRRATRLRRWNRKPSGARSQEMVCGPEDNPAKRKELGRVIQEYLPESFTAYTELQDVVNAIRAVLDVQGVQQLLSRMRWWFGARPRWCWRKN